MTYKVLILDCNDFEREKLKINLGSIGKFSFAELSNTQDFFIVQKQLKDFSLIILDLAFPNTNEGYHILQSISLNPRLSSTPVIIISREDAVFHKNTAMTQYHVKDYIQKPYTHERLSASIKAIIPLDAQFFYSFENTSIVSLSVEDLISQQLSITKRANKELSIIFITPNLIKMEKSFSDTNFDCSREIIYQNISKYIKLSLRASDIVLVVNKTDIVVLLHFTGAAGANTVVKKIKRSINVGLGESGFEFDNLFYLSIVTFPVDGEDIDTLMNTAIKRVHNKSALDKIVSVSKQKFNNANTMYKKFS